MLEYRHLAGETEHRALVSCVVPALETGAPLGRTLQEQAKKDNVGLLLRCRFRAGDATILLYYYTTVLLDY